MGLEMGNYVLGGKPTFDSGGSLYVNTGGHIEGDVVWSVVTNGKTVTEGGTHVQIVDTDVSTFGSLSNTSVSDEGWAIVGDIGRIVTLKRLYCYYGLTTATGRGGRVLLKTSTDNSTWTTVQTGTAAAPGTVSDQYDAASRTLRYIKFEYDQTVDNLSVAATMYVYCVLMLGGD